MSTRPTYAFDLSAYHTPWLMKPLDEWSIVGLNHYSVNGERRLFVAMTKDGHCIQEEGPEDQYLWNRLWHKAIAQAAMALLVLVMLPALSLAQQPQPLRIVSNCVKGVYDECQFVPPHWYYRVGAVWTRDDGVVGKPPAVPVVLCPSDTSKLKTNGSPWNLNAKASVLAFAATASLDCRSTGSLRENNPLLRNSHSGINQAACGAINGTALGLTILLQKNHPKIANWFRWIGAGAHGSAAAWNWSTR